MLKSLIHTFRKDTQRRSRGILMVAALLASPMLGAAIVPPDPSVTLLHSFAAVTGLMPQGALAMQADGSLWGTTRNGGKYGKGVIYRIDPAGAVAAMADFDEDTGSFPVSALTRGPDGALYGTTSTEGLRGAGGGSVFKVSPAGELTILFHFNPLTTGYAPQSGVAFDANGNLYGSTEFGGAAGKGTIYRLSPAGVYTTLLELGVGNNLRSPRGGVVAGADGSVYATAVGSGTNGSGAVFRVLPGGGLQIYAAFSSGVDGDAPEADLLMAPDGTVYGGTSNRGSNSGVLFKISPQGVYSVVYAFSQLPSAVQAMYSASRGRMAIDQNGTVYGIAVPKGTGYPDILYSISSAGQYHQIASINLPMRASAGVSLSSGNSLILPEVHGGIAAGGLTTGSVLRVLLTGEVSTLHSFLYYRDGQSPGGLAQANDGTLYGITNAGGLYGDGTVFKRTPGGPLSVLHHFNPANEGTLSQGPIAIRADGTLYGTKSSADSPVGRPGVLYKVAPNGVYTKLMDLTRVVGGNTFSSWPAGVKLASDGNLYGALTFGGAYGKGAIFRVTPADQYSLVASFMGDAAGSSPSPPVLAGDGNLYGIAGEGYPSGVIYRVTPGGNLSVVYSFQGWEPRREMTLGSDGNLYGAMVSVLNEGEDPESQRGVLYRFVPGGSVQVLGEDLPYAYANVAVAADGSFYTGSGTLLYRLSAAGEWEPIANLEGLGYVQTLLAGVDGAIYNYTSSSERGGSIYRIEVPAPDTKPDAFSFVNAPGAGLNALVQSRPLTVSGINTAAPISVIGGEYRIGASAWTSAPGFVGNGQVVQVRRVSASTGNTGKRVDLKIGGVVGSFIVKTGNFTADFIPDAFKFLNSAAVARNATVMSKPVVPVGYDAPADVSIGGLNCQYSVNGGAFTLNSGTISPGQSLRLRRLTPSAANTQFTCIVTVGTIEGRWIGKTGP